MANKILIVEDDFMLLDIFKTKFKKSGFKVFTALDGFEGLEAARKNNPDLILLDIMPGMNGFQVLEKLKADERTKDIVVYILSNLGQQQEIDKGLRMGADRYLVKANMTPEGAVQAVREGLE